MLTSDVCTPRGTLAHPSGRASGKVAAWEERARGGQDAQRPVTRGNVSPPGWSEPVAWLHAVLRPGVERLLGAGGGGGAGGSHSAVDTGRKLNFSGVTSAAPPPDPSAGLRQCPCPTRRPRRAPGAAGCARPHQCARAGHGAAAPTAAPRPPLGRARPDHVHSAVPREGPAEPGGGARPPEGPPEAPRACPAGPKPALFRAETLRQSCLTPAVGSSLADVPDPEPPRAPHDFVCFQEPVRYQNDHMFQG